MSRSESPATRRVEAPAARRVVPAAAGRASLPVIGLALLLALVAALIAGGILFLDDSGLREEPALARDVPAEAPEPELVPAVLGDVAEDAGDAARREVAASRGREELERGAARWIEGRIELPAGLPADEAAVVLALEEEHDAEDLYGSDGWADGLEDSPPASIAVRAWDALHEDAWEEVARIRGLLRAARAAPDGSFRIGLPADLEVAHLAVSGRYLWSAGTTEVELATRDAAEPVELRPRLGGWLRGEAIASERVPEGLRVRLEPRLDSFSPSNLDRAAFTGVFLRRAAVAADGAFEFRGLPVGREHDLRADHESWVSEPVASIELEAGERGSVGLLLRPGGRMAGRVLDGEGSPIAGARLEVRRGGFQGMVSGDERETESAADGAYSFDGLSVAELLVDVRAEGRRGLTGERVRIEEYGATVRRDFTLVRGRSIAGRVAWPNGAPAGGAEIEVRPDLAAGASAGGAFGNVEDERESEADVEGRFETWGLGSGPYVVVAELEDEEGLEHRAIAERVEPVEGRAVEVELVLAPPILVRGTVASTAGDPIDAFRVVAVREGTGGMFGMGAERRSEDFEEAGGSFVLDELHPGEWSILVDADGWSRSEGTSVELAPGASPEELGFVLAPSASAEGVVHDTTGAPIEGARVTLELTLAEQLARIGEAEGPPGATSDAEGRFLLEDLDPGELALAARKEGFATSEAAQLEAAPGERVRGIVLRLKVGAFLTGEVLDDGGEPIPDVTVIAQVPATMRNRLSTTDEEGWFRFDHLDPGTWQVVAMPGMFDGPPADEADGEDAADFMANMKIAAVELDEGETEHVVLGGEPEVDRVAIEGHVEAAGEDVEGAMISFVPQDGGGMSAMKFTRTDDAGGFEVTVDGPGLYLVSVQVDVEFGRNNTVEFVETIPAGAETHELELDLPVGRVSGRVLGPEGAPAGGARITLNVDGGIAYGTLMGGKYAETVTKSDGTYDLRYLPAGTYTVAAGGAAFGGFLGEVGEHGRSVRSGVRVDEGAWARGVDFRLERAGAIRGVVRDAGGSPVAGAAIFVRDAAGNLLERFAMLASDERGRFVYQGVAPGEYTVAARTGELASGRGASIRVRQGEEQSVEIVLEAGTVLLVSVVDTTGEDVRAVVSVEDDAGFEVNGMVAMSDLMEDFAAGLSSTEQRIGPVPPGRYEISAHAEDGRSVRKTLVLSGQEERQLKLRLRD